MARGGMRWGAGRPGWHVKAEHCRRLDVRRWHRDDLLRPGISTSWIWTDSETGERLASIGFSVAEHHLTLDYRINDVPVRQEVRLERTACHYGGLRPWFRCPKCARKVALLYLRSNGAFCRHCQRVAYASQSDDLCARTWRKQAKLEAQLGPYWQRPKGMHDRTRERLLQGTFACEAVREDALAAYLSRVVHLM